MATPDAENNSPHPQPRTLRSGDGISADPAFGHHTASERKVTTEHDAATTPQAAELTTPFGEGNDAKLQQMGQAPIIRILLLFGIPGVLSQLVQTSYSVIDTMFVGQAAGDKGLAALTLVFPPILALIALAAFSGSGGGIIHNQALGAQDKARASAVVSQVLVLQFIAYALALLITFGVAIPIIRHLDYPPEIIDLGCRYLAIYTLGFITQALGYTLSGFIAGCGHPRLQLGLHTLAAVLNIALDYLFLIQLRWGVEWAAIATVIAWTVPALLSAAFFVSGRAPYRLRTTNLRPDLSLMKTSVVYGLPVLLMQIGSVIYVAVFLHLLSTAAAATGFPEAVALANGNVVSRAYSVLLIPALGFCMGASPVLAYTYGAKNVTRLRSLFWSLVLAGTLCVVALWIPALVWARPIALSFGLQGANATLTATYLRLELLAAPLVAFYCAVSFLCQAIGKYKQASIIMLGFSVLVQLPVVLACYYFLPAVFDMDPLIAIYSGAPVTDVVLALIGIIIVLPIVRSTAMTENGTGDCTAASDQTVVRHET